MIIQGPEVVLWVAEKTGIIVHDKCVALGYVKNNQIIAGVAFERWTGKDIIGHQRIDEPPPKGFWLACAHYAYQTLGVKRITGLVDSSNTRAIRVNYKMGYELEAILKEAGTEGNDLLIMVMWRDKCRILQWGKKAGE